MEDYNRLFPGVPEAGTIAIKANVSSAHYWFIARSAGIGMLPTYAPAIGARVVPVEVEDVRSLARHLAHLSPRREQNGARAPSSGLADRSVLAPAVSWFRDEFIHPRDLPARINDAPIGELFEGFAGMESTPRAAKPRLTPEKAGRD